MNRFWPLFFLCWCLFSAFAWGADRDGFTQRDRERLIRLESTFAVSMEQTNKRFEDINKRFEDINRRFEDMNKRFEDMNKRFEELRADMNARFDQLYTFLWIISGIFSAMVVAVIGFAYWDRRTILSRAKEESVKEVDRAYSVSQFKAVLSALRKLSEKDEEVARVLRSFGLL